jgi:hypothetical protein
MIVSAGGVLRRYPGVRSLDAGGRMHGRSLDAPPDAAVPLADAARTLRISRDALRKRLDRGTARGYKRDAGWFVWLDAAGQDATGRTDAATADATADTTAAVAHLQAERDHLQALLERSDQERGHLRTLVERGDQERAELRRLLAAALARPALTSGQDAAGDTADPPSRPWWRRWWPWSRSSKGNDT